MSAKFKIPEISFVEVKPKVWETTNTFHPYVVRELEGVVLVHYTDFSHPHDRRMPNEFKSLEMAKSWIVETHYPAQIAKFLEVLED